MGGSLDCLYILKAHFYDGRRISSHIFFLQMTKIQMWMQLILFQVGSEGIWVGFGWVLYGFLLGSWLVPGEFQVDLDRFHMAITYNNNLS